MTRPVPVLPQAWIVLCPTMLSKINAESTSALSQIELNQFSAEKTVNYSVVQDSADTYSTLYCMCAQYTVFILFFSPRPGLLILGRLIAMKS